MILNLTYPDTLEIGLSFQMTWPSQPFARVFAYYTNQIFFLSNHFLFAPVFAVVCSRAILFAVAVTGPPSVYRGPRVLRHLPLKAQGRGGRAKICTFRPHLKVHGDILDTGIFIIIFGVDEEWI